MDRWMEWDGMGWDDGVRLLMIEDGMDRREEE